MTDLYLTTFYRFCTRCMELVPEDRLRRGANTCSTECKRQDRKAQRRQQKLWSLERVRVSQDGKRLVHGKRRTAPHHPDSEAGVAQAVINHSEQEQ